MAWKRWGKSLADQGTAGLPDRIKKRVRLTNSGAVFGAIAMIATMPFDVAHGQWWMVVIDVVAVGVFLALPIANRRGHVVASRLVLIVGANLLALANAIGLGRDSGVELLFLAMIGIPFALFDLRDRGPLALGLLVPVVFLGLYESDLLSSFRVDAAGYSPHAYHLYSVVLAVMIVLFAFYTASRENERAERELAESRQASINAAKMAALGEMSASVAHEVNNPLAAILLRAQRLESLAQKGRLQEEAVLKAARDIGRTVGRIRRIVDALRTIARQGDEDPLRPEPVEAIVKDTVELSVSRFRSREIDLAIDPIPEGLLAQCRSAQIAQILLNLLSNSYDAVESQVKRWVRIKVEARGDEIQIAVTDSGKGIPEKIAPRIMEPFFTTKEIGRGTGLGLSLSKGIAEAHGGRLELDSHSPETRFVLTLRRGDQQGKCHP